MFIRAYFKRDSKEGAQNAVHLILEVPVRLEMKFKRNKTLTLTRTPKNEVDPLVHISLEPILL